MIYKKQFQLLKSLPKKLNTFSKKIISSLNVKNKSKSLKDYDPVTNLIEILKNLLEKLSKINFQMME